MKLKTLSAALIFLAVAPAISADTDYLQGLGDTRYQLFESKIIGRDFHIYVSLPDDYEDSAESYPTIYLLDGGNLFPMLTPYYRYLNFGEEVPDSIIVGISYGNDNFEGGNYRSTDFTAPSNEREYWGGAAAYQKFLSDELMPSIEAQYRSDSSRRIVFGQSIGGQFVLYTALTKPGLFWGHIASNPALHRNLRFFLEIHGESADMKERSRLFVGSGTLDDPIYRDPAQKWIQHWNLAEDRPWELRTMNLDGHSHMSAPPTSFRQGMIWLFAEN